MTVTIQPDNATVVDVRQNHAVWCVYEHWAALEDGKPPSCIMVGTCRLVDVYKFGDSRINTEWVKIFQGGGSIMVRILATSMSRSEMIIHAIKASRSHKPRPVCNEQGYAIRGLGRRIQSTSGAIYANQTAAANALGVTQSAISRHLSGHSPHIRGELLTYVGAEE